MKNEKTKGNDDWGSFAQAEKWRQESFRSRTHAQRLQWLKSALKLHYQAQENKKDRGAGNS